MIRPEGGWEVGEIRCNEAFVSMTKKTPAKSVSTSSTMNDYPLNAGDLQYEIYKPRAYVYIYKYIIDGSCKHENKAGQVR